MKTLDIIIPCYNEEKRLNATFSALRKGFFSADLILEKVIFINDGSTDQTQQVLLKNKKRLEKDLKANIEIIFYTQNKGKGFAVKEGMLASTACYTLLVDADMSTPLSELNKFGKFIQKGENIIIGTRKNGHSTVVVPQPIYRQLMGRVFTLISQIILNTWVTDFTCGFKLFSNTAREAIFSRARIDRWGYDSEILFLARKLNFKINEQAVIWSNDKGSKVNVMRDAIKSFYELLLIRYNSFRGEYSQEEKSAYSFN